ncbi:uncharacterized protein J7T54_000500 [Emericellopsis cladophorae]|uniref:DUF6546 domain-containing protein n=1 Tax=Emericellopsis cladophorae TaxID=2686198 RepID=A0A9Q0B9B2_9HYPO|nr:uncharacterized protein J7T54_000500 [Emericellopsis cladophorae]KAI6778382.1 hypothetical protein J7T54_000500 [Emericellopsis cladophorae]
MTLGDTLIPQTIVDRIVDYLRADDEYASLAPYATVSKSWQIAVERHTFRQLYISSARLDDLNTIVCRRRQRTLQVIALHIALASYHKNQRSDAESREDGSATTRIFTSFMQDFFGTLSKWEVEHGPPEGIHVEILIESPSDESSSSSRRVSPATTRRARASPVRIDLHRDALPAALVASALTCTGRHIELTSVLLLLEKMPNLRLLDTELEHDTNGSRDLEQRRGLELYAPNVTDLRLRRPQNASEPRNKPTRDARALFYNVLASYTRRCTDLTFDDSVDAREFFAPYADESHQESRHIHPGTWRRLERLHIRNSYMLRRPYMRVATRATALQHVHEVLTLVGRALRAMPVVENVRIRQYILTEEGLQTISVRYYFDGRVPMIWFSGIKPVRATLEAWRASVRDRRGAHLRIDVDA